MYLLQAYYAPFFHAVSSYYVATLYQTGFYAPGIQQWKDSPSPCSPDAYVLAAVGGTRENNKQIRGHTLSRSLKREM